MSDNYIKHTGPAERQKFRSTNKDGTITPHVKLEGQDALAAKLEIVIRLLTQIATNTKKR